MCLWHHFINPTDTQVTSCRGKVFWDVALQKVAFGDGFKERFGYEYLDVQIEFRQFRVHLPCCPSHPFYQFQLHHSMIR